MRHPDAKRRVQKEYPGVVAFNRETNIQPPNITSQVMLCRNQVLDPVSESALGDCGHAAAV